MLTTMATALLNAIPGESPETRLAAFAERLGAVYEGSCWRMSPAVRETLRDAAVALALEPPEPVDDATDPGWEAVVLEAESRRQARTAERVTTRFSRACRGAGRQALTQQGHAGLPLPQTGCPRQDIEAAPGDRLQQGLPDSFCRWIGQWFFAQHQRAQPALPARQHGGQRKPGRGRRIGKAKAARARKRG